MRTQDDELSMHKIEDYDNKESQSKRNTVRTVIAIGLIIGAIFAIFKYENNVVDDYVGTQDNPGINTAKK
ncbi:hypothetical protein [Arcobacter sp. CECT 8985]|uniref:hypothetical protein n=1 Tax=Arcobacter sp. CECT 8985 TaxID=1935424 RepID=UPI00100B4515|nr:hypothetical protein [Arcobacter sp. CECT 8985]RXJ86654.1 hypothetical protein CRU93_07520 [Arcobacter sp. CECT 8985]